MKVLDEEKPKYGLTALFLQSLFLKQDCLLEIPKLYLIEYLPVRMVYLVKKVQGSLLGFAEIALYYW